MRIFRTANSFTSRNMGFSALVKVKYMTSTSDVKEATLRRTRTDTKWTMTFQDWLDAGLARNGASAHARQEGLAVRYIGAGENGRSCRQCSRRSRGGEARFRPIPRTASACAPGGQERRGKESPARRRSGRGLRILRGASKDSCTGSASGLHFWRQSREKRRQAAWGDGGRLRNPLRHFLRLG